MAAPPAVPLTPELIETVLTRIAAGESLRGICRDEGMPDMAQIMRLRISDKEFAKQYTYAREMQAEVFGDELVEIVDDGSNDWMEKKFGQQTAWVLNGEAVARSRLRFDQRRWWMSKVLPKIYGDKLAVEHSVDESLKNRLKEARARRSK
jgi:hypothetical protein